MFLPDGSSSVYEANFTHTDWSAPQASSISIAPVVPVPPVNISRVVGTTRALNARQAHSASSVPLLAPRAIQDTARMGEKAKAGARDVHKGKRTRVHPAARRAAIATG